MRVFANRSIVDPVNSRDDSLANPDQAKRLESAITNNQRVHLERFSFAGSHQDSDKNNLTVWPLQLIFHNIGWYLAFEIDRPGEQRKLISTMRLDRLALRRVEPKSRDPKDKAKAIDTFSKLFFMDIDKSPLGSELVIQKFEEGFVDFWKNDSRQAAPCCCLIYLQHSSIIC